MSQQLRDHLLVGYFPNENEFPLQFTETRRVKRLLLFLCFLLATSLLYVEFTNRKRRETVDVVTSVSQEQTSRDVVLDLWNTSSTTDENIFDTCPLPESNPWNAETVRALGAREIKHCAPAAEPPTILTGKRIVRNPKHPRFSQDMRCQARCALYVAENKPMFYDKWRDIDEAYEHKCDIIQVECTYGWMLGKEPYVHIQIHEHERDRFQSAPGNGQKPSGAPKIGNDSFHPNVYVIMLDSVSVNAAYRQIGKTITFLEKGMQAVRFEHLAKVGENSKPNAYALFFGEIPINVDRSMFGVKEPLAYTLDVKNCDQALDGKNFIHFEYEDAGYKTMWSCDYLAPTFATGGCPGIVAQPTTHYMRLGCTSEAEEPIPWQFPGFFLGQFPDAIFTTPTPSGKYTLGTENNTLIPFQEILKHDGSIINVMINRSVCRTGHEYILDYTDKFFRAYPGNPKMSTTWVTDAAHDSEKDLADADFKFLDLFVKNKRELDQSILIVMGDHGPRLEGASSTKQGILDRANPMLWISLPKRLRGTEMHETLRENAKYLSSHHDVHATLKDILWYQPSSIFTDTNYRPINNSYGSSLLRKFDPKTPRNCKNLPIPALYCLCNYGQKPEYDQSKLETLGNLTVYHINDRIKQSGMADMCALQELLHVNSCYKVDAAQGASVYSIHLRTKLGAEFRMKFLEHANGDTEVISGSEERLDKYGDQAACVPAEHLALRPFCYCNEKKN